MEILTADTKLSIENLSKQFDGVSVLQNISFTVQSGEFLTILGASGCGKTTLLRILIGLLKPDSGSVKRDGNDITAAHPSQRQMGIVFQNYALFPNMSVLGNVEYALKQNADTKPFARKLAEHAVELVGLSEHKDKKPHQLSGGQQQRAAIARTIAMQPEIILFDEPMSALDAATRLQLREELKKLQTKLGVTIVYITHDQEEAFVLSDRIMVLHEGRIQQIGTPAEIVSAPANAYVNQFVAENLHRKVDALLQFARQPQ